MAGFWEETQYWLDILSSHGVGVKAVSEVCPRAGGLSRRRPHEIIVVVVGVAQVRPSSCAWIPTEHLKMLTR